MIKNLVTAIFAAALFMTILMADRIMDTTAVSPDTDNPVTEYHGDIIIIPENNGIHNDTPWVPPVVSISPSTNPASYSDTRAPVYLPPESSDNARDFFKDVVFIGDSISVMLRAHNELTGVLGDAMFIAKEGYGMGHAVNGTMLPEYNGMSISPEDALVLSGAKKVFIMLGANDIGSFGVDGTMEKWEIVIPKLREASPNIQIYIQSCTPIWTGGEVGLLNNTNIDNLNLRLKKFAEENGCCFIDISPYMKDSTGGLPSEYSSDCYVHLTNAGADAWAKILLAYADALSE